jgi:hypothetical protein
VNKIISGQRLSEPRNKIMSTTSFPLLACNSVSQYVITNILKWLLPSDVTGIIINSQPFGSTAKKPNIGNTKARHWARFYASSSHP